MSALLDVFGELLLAALRIVVQVPLIWLGEIVRWAVTLGRHEPRWDCYTHESGGTFVLLSEISFWIGAFAAAGIGVLIKFSFFTS